MNRPRRPAGADQTVTAAHAMAVAMVGEGVDLDDRDSVAEWMQAFNARPYDERAAILTDEVIAAAGVAATVVLPDEEGARASAARCPLLAQARLLVDFVGDGAKLTQTGNLTLGDARQLVGILGTGDRIDETIGERTFKTRSAADLPHLSFVVRLATSAHFVRKVKGRLVSTKAGRSLGKDPLADLYSLIEAIDDTGLVTARRAGGRYIWTTLAPFFDELFVPLTLFLLSAPHGVAFLDIVEQAYDDFEDEIDLDNPHWDETRRHDLVESEMAAAIETLEAAGAAHWDSETETSTYGTTTRRRGTVALTPAGRWVLHRYLEQAHGMAMPAAGPTELTDHDFDALVLACDTGSPGDFDRLTREISAWIDQRGDHARAALAAAARTTTDPAVRAIALAVLSEHFGPDAEADVRSLLDDPATRGAALVWLVDHELEPADVLIDPDPAVLVDVLALTLVNRGLADMIEVFDHAGSHDTQIALLQQLWRQPSPAAGPVLGTLGSQHPVPRIAKAARKAAMQHASFHANLGISPLGGRGL